MPRLLLTRPEGLSVPLPIDGRPLVLGRQSDCDVLLMHGQISRQHAVVRAMKGGLFLQDKSANGTRLNGQKLSRGRWYPLTSGDYLSVGPVTLKVEDAA